MIKIMEDKNGPKSEIEIINISYDMSVRFWFIGPLISDMSTVRVRQFMKFFSTDTANGEMLNMEKNMKQQNRNLESLYCKFSFQFHKVLF